MISLRNIPLFKSVNTQGMHGSSEYLTGIIDRPIIFKRAAMAKRKYAFIKPVIALIALIVVSILTFLFIQHIYP